MLWIVMEQRQPLHAGGDGVTDGVVETAVSPSAFVFVLSGGVLRFADQQVGPERKIPHGLIARAVVGLMIGEVDYDLPRALQPVGDTPAGMVHRLRSHMHLAQIADPIDLMKANVGSQGTERYGEIRLLHLLLEGIGVLPRRIKIDARAGPVSGIEEREALEVIHVAVRDEQIDLPDAFVLERVAQFADTGARIQDDDARAAADLDAGSIPATPQRRRPGGGDGPPGSPELN